MPLWSEYTPSPIILEHHIDEGAMAVLTKRPEETRACSGAERGGPGAHRYRLGLLSGDQLKVIALISMTVDHIGYALVPGCTILRIVGRIAFVLYAFLLAEGCRHTHSMRAYIGRLAMFALISEIPFTLMVANRLFLWGRQNVFFTLLYAACSIGAARWIYSRIGGGKGKVLALFPLLVGMLLARAFRSDYSWAGVLTVYVFYYLNRYLSLQLLAVLALRLRQGWLQSCGVAAFVPIALYNGEKGRAPSWFKWVFYVYYPAHLFVIWLIGVLLSA